MLNKTAELKQTAKSVFLRKGDLWVIAPQVRNRREAFQLENIFQGRSDFFKTFVIGCKNNQTRRISFKEEKLETDLYQSKMEEKLTDFRYYAHDEIIEITLSIISEIKKGERFYFKYMDSIVSIIRSSELGMCQLFMESIREKHLLPAGSMILNLQIQGVSHELIKN